MLSLPPSVRIYLCRIPADMRRSFDGLAALAQTVVGQDPLSGHLFVFRNRRGDRLKALWWDGDGYALFAKRLEIGVFRFPESTEETIVVTPTQLAMVLGGVELKETRRRKRYAREPVTCS